MQHCHSPAAAAAAGICLVDIVIVAHLLWLTCRANVQAQSLWNVAQFKAMAFHCGNWEYFLSFYSSLSLLELVDFHVPFVLS